MLWKYGDGVSSDYSFVMNYVWWESGDVITEDEKILRQTEKINTF